MDAGGDPYGLEVLAAIHKISPDADPPSVGFLVSAGFRVSSDGHVQ
jgi:hypothetical protein